MSSVNNINHSHKLLKAEKEIGTVYFDNFKTYIWVLCNLAFVMVQWYESVLWDCTCLYPDSIVCIKETSKENKWNMQWIIQYLSDRKSKLELCCNF